MGKVSMSVGTAAETECPMQVNCLSHVNIIVDDIDAAAAFYCDLLSLVRTDAPPPISRSQAAWLVASDGNAIIHLNSPDLDRPHNRKFDAGPTGALHHVALNCRGYNVLVSRLTKQGIPFETHDFPTIDLRQIFMHDPQGVLLELNFLERRQ